MEPLDETAQRITTSPLRMSAALANKDLESAGPLSAVMMIYVVIVLGRIGSLVPFVEHVPLAKIIAALAIIIAVQRRATLAPISIWSLPPARLTLLIMSLVTLSIFYSALRRATFGTITGTALSVSVELVLMIKSARNWASIRRLLFGCLLSALVLCCAAELTRLGVRAGSTRDMDPNDFAFVFDGLLPIVVTFALVSSGFKRICFTGISIWVVLEILRTESRGGLLGLIAVAVLMIILLPARRSGHLLPASSKTKIAVRILIVIMAAILAWHVIPESARTRLATLRNPDSGYNANLNNPNGRFAIWLQTLPLSLRRPWGWGAGSFGAVNGKFGGGKYRAAHNMYLQALIELGVEGLALFLAVLISSFRRLRREAFALPEPVERERLEQRAFARAMLASFIGLCISGFFLAELYNLALWTLIILSCLVGRSVSRSRTILPGTEASASSA